MFFLRIFLALSAYERQQHQIEIAIAAAINGGSDSPERNNSSSFNGVNNEEFVRRLIDAVKREPCLYNPNHEHYGNKHSSAHYRVLNGVITQSNFAFSLPFGKGYAKNWITQKIHIHYKCNGSESGIDMCERNEKGEAFTGI